MNDHRRKGRGKSKRSLDLIEAAVRIMQEIQPASIRAVCYRLFVEGRIDSMSKSNTNAVSTHLVCAREQELLPWAFVVDETREAERPGTWQDPDAIIQAAVGQYRRDRWQDQSEWVEVWSEKGTIRGTLSPVLKEYGVTFRVMHGYGSATSLYDTADATRNCDKPLTILYVRDWDPSGLHMSEIDLPRRLERYEGSATIKRIALRDEDIGPALPSFDAESKSKDPRHRWYRERYGDRCWELDALSPVTLRGRVEAEILSHLDIDAWDHAADTEAAEVESMQDFLSEWHSKSVLATKYSVRE